MNVLGLKATAQKTAFFTLLQVKNLFSYHCIMISAMTY